MVGVILAVLVWVGVGGSVGLAVQVNVAVAAKVAVAAVVGASAALACSPLPRTVNQHNIPASHRPTRGNHHAPLDFLGISGFSSGLIPGSTSSQRACKRRIK